jgi:hypothetical protein
MSTSFLSVLIMFFIDGYMHIFFTHYSTLEAVITILGRLIQYHGVTFLIYWILYWPYRRNFLPNGAGALDVEMDHNTQSQPMNGGGAI